MGLCSALNINSRILALPIAATLFLSLAQMGSANAQEPQFLFKFKVASSSYPIGIAIDSSDNVYVVYDAAGIVQKYTSTGTLIKTWNTGFNRPDDIVIDKYDNVYVSERPEHRVWKFNTDGDVLKIIGGFGSGDGQFNQVRGLAVDKDANLYVADQFNHRIQVFDSNGNFLFKFGQAGTGDGQLTYAEGIRLDSAGNIFVSDVNDKGTRIQKFTGSGQFTGWLGKCTGGTNCDTDHERSKGFTCTEETCTGFGEGSRDGQLDGTDPSIALSGFSNNFAPGLLIDSEDNLYAAEYGNHRVQKFSSTGEFLGWAGKCTGGSNCDMAQQRSVGFTCTETTCTGLGPGLGDGQFLRPQRIAMNSLGNIYVLDARDQYDVISFDDEDNIVHVYGTSIPTSLTVNSADLKGSPMAGLWTTIRSNDGTLIESGFTPMSFAGIAGSSYKVTVANYDGKVFSKWQDDNSTSKTRTITLASNTTLTAIYDIGDALRGFTSLAYTGTSEQPDLTVNATTLEGNKPLHMWTLIYPQSTNSSGTTYKLYATNGYQNLIFDHWSDNGSTDRIRTLTINEATTITAYYKAG